MKRAFLVTGLVFACASPELHDRNRGLLDEAHGLIESHELRQADTVLQTLVADTTAEPRTYALQRAFAFHLLARLHVEAGANGAFLTEPNERGGTRSSPAAHLIQSTFWTALSGAELQRARFDRAATDLPEALQELGPDDLDLRMLLDLIVVNTRLGFDVRSSELCDDLAHDDPEFLQSYEHCQQAARAAGLVEPIDAWLYLALHRHFARLGGRINQESAYQFGILARDSFLAADTTEGRAIANDIVQWIVNHDDYWFESSEGTRFQENQPLCVLSGETSIQFRAIPKNGP